MIFMRGCAVALTFFAALSHQVAAQSAVLLQDVAIVDVERGSVSSGMSVLIEDGMIREVGAGVVAPGACG